LYPHLENLSSLYSCSSRKRFHSVGMYVRDCFECPELDDCDDKVESPWVKMRGKANKVDVLLGVCDRPPNQDEEADEVFYKQKSHNC